MTACLVRSALLLMCMVGPALPAEAIRQYFDPVIQSLSQSNHDPDVQVYAAHGMVESLMYAAMAAAADNKGKSSAKHKSIVLDGAWTDALEMKAFVLTELGRLDESEQLALAWRANPRSCCC